MRNTYELVGLFMSIRIL